MPFLRTCIDCGNEKLVKASADGGKKRCRSCSTRHTGKTKKRTANKNPEDLKRYERVCVDCKGVTIFKSQHMANSKRCKECAKKSRAVKVENYIRVCESCGDEKKVNSPAASKSTSCNSCAAKVRRADQLKKKPAAIKVKAIKVPEPLKRYTRVCVDCKEVREFRSSYLAEATRCKACNSKHRKENKKLYTRVCEGCGDEKTSKYTAVMNSKLCIGCYKRDKAAAAEQRKLNKPKPVKKIKVKKPKKLKKKKAKKVYPAGGIGVDGLQKVVITPKQKPKREPKSEADMIAEFMKNNEVTVVEPTYHLAVGSTSSSMNLSGTYV